jgi:Kef-type K+ transport system membrane component KefB
MFRWIEGDITGEANSPLGCLLSRVKSPASLIDFRHLPLFFAYTGLRTDIGGLANGHLWLLCLLVCALAFSTKLLGAFVGARVAGESPRSAVTIAVCMNTRALMELVVLNVGYELGVLPRPMFTMLVLMAIGSTYLATPLIRRLMRGEPPRPADVLAPAHTHAPVVGVTQS